VLPPTAPGHVGFTGTSIWLLPGIDAVVVLLTNRVHPEVEDVDFQPVRLAFHRAAAGLLASAPGAPSA
jgi:CubicO group peptidase (beta-lactamase class C family)